jgi:hypothetical protein
MKFDDSMYDWNISMWDLENTYIANLNRFLGWIGEK